MDPLTLSFALGTGVFILTAHDCTFTQRRIRKYGFDIETNSLVKWMLPRLGIDLSLGLGILAPTLVIMSTMVAYEWSTCLAVWFGMKLLNTRYQYLSLEVEAEIDRLRSESTGTSSYPRDDDPSGPAS